MRNPQIRYAVRFFCRRDLVREVIDVDIDGVIAQMQDLPQFQKPDMGRDGRTDMLIQILENGEPWMIRSVGQEPRYPTGNIVYGRYIANPGRLEEEAARLREMDDDLNGDGLWEAR